MNKNADEIFKDNIGSNIKAEVFSSQQGNIIFEGVLDDIVRNQFFIKNDNKTVVMFRYEDLRNLQIIE